jgi:WD40 repeat protein
MLVVVALAISYARIAQEHQVTQQTLVALREEQEKTQQALDDKQEALGQRTRALQEAEGQRTQTQEALERLQRTSYAQTIVLAERETDADHTAGLEKLLADCQPDLRHWEWNRLYRVAHAEQLARQHLGGRFLAWGPGTNQLITIASPKPGFWESKVWDAATGNELRTARVSAGPPPSLSPDGKRLAVIVPQSLLTVLNSPASLKIIDVATGKEAALWLPKSAENYGSPVWSPNGKRLASKAKDNTVTVWDGATADEVCTLRGRTQDTLIFGQNGFHRDQSNYSVDQLSWSPGGHYLITRNTVQATVWDVATGSARFQILQAEGYDLQSLRWSPDGNLLAAVWTHWMQRPGESAQPRFVKIWNVGRGGEIVRLKCSERSAAVRFTWNASGNGIATATVDDLRGASSGELKIWDAASGQEVRALEGLTSPASTIAFRPGPNDMLLAVTSVDQTVRVWDTAPSATSKQPLCQLKGLGISLLAEPWSPDGYHLLGKARNSATSVTPVLKVWSALTGEEILTLKPRERDEDAAVWSPDARRLATLEGGTVKVWALPRKLPTVAEGIWSPDGQRVASVNKELGTIEVRDASTGAVGVIYTAHAGGPVGAVAWDREGKRLATASADYTVKVWDSATGNELVAFRRHRGPVYGVWWGADQRHLISLGTDSNRNLEIKGWDAATEAEGFTLGSAYQWNTFWPVPAAVSGDGRRVATIGFEKVREAGTAISHNSGFRVWDTADGTEVFQGKDFSPFGLWLNHDGTRLAAVGQGAQGSHYRIRVWRVADGKQVADLQEKDLGQGAFNVGGNQIRLSGSRDGRRLAVSMPGAGSIALWDEATGKITSIKRRPATGQVLWSPDGRRLLVPGDDGSLIILDAVTGESVLTIRKENADDMSAPPSWSPDGKYLAAIASGRSASGDSLHTIKIWNAASGALVRAIEDGHAQQIGALAWSPDGKQLATGGYDQTARVWDVATGRSLVMFTGHAGDLAVPRSIRWNNPEYRPNFQAVGGNALQIGAIAWSADRCRVASVSRFPGAPFIGVVRLWDPETGATIRTLQGPGGEIWALAWGPDGRRLATVHNAHLKAGINAEVRVWDAATGVNSFTFPYDPRFTVVSGSAPLAFSPDGERIAVHSGQTVKIWDVAARREVLTLPGQTSRPLAWSPDGRRLAMLATADNQETHIAGHDAATGVVLGKPKSHRGGVQSLLWSRDGKRLFIGGADNLITVWDPETGTDLLHLKGSGGLLSWAADGESLVSVGTDGLHIWEATGPGGK